MRFASCGVAVAAAGAVAMAGIARAGVEISEVMADNGKSVVTAGGVAGLDWVELRNTGSEAVDLSGWLVTDDPAKDASLWRPIDGAAVVPPGGTIVVFADSSFADWSVADAHVAVGFSSNGESVVLAKPDGTVVDSLEFGEQMKDVSYGRVNTTDAVLPRGAAARYRVGEGEWKDSTGWVGMPGAAPNSFSVNSIEFRNPVNSVSDVVELALDPTKIKRSVETSAAVVCYGSRICPEYTWWDKIALPTEYGGNADGSDGNPFAAQFPLGDTTRNFGLFARASVSVPRSGKWTFAGGTIGDGFRLRLSRLGSQWEFSKEPMGAQHFTEYVKTFDLEAGVYDLEFVFFNPNWHKQVSLGVAEGEYSSFQAGAFTLVGSEACPVRFAASLGSCVANDVTQEMAGVSDTLSLKSEFSLDSAPAEGDSFILRLRYSDAFTAMVNGTVVASATPGARTAAEICAAADFEFSSALVHAGVNELEITGVNGDVSDGVLVLAPEVLRVRSGENVGYFSAPTPNAPNAATACTARTPRVRFSVPHGYKTEPFDLELSINSEKHPDAVIRYTLDGTSPTSSSAAYEGPIRISRTTCVRAAVVDERSVLQCDTSATYLFLDDVLAQRQDVVPDGFIPSGVSPSVSRSWNVWGQSVDYTQQMRYGMRQDLVNAERERIEKGFTNSISTISLVVDPALLFDDERGVYVHPDGDGSEWEAKTMIEQIDPVSGEANEFSSVAGLRIRGAGSRSTSNAKHSFRVVFRSKYGDGKLSFPLFGAEGAQEFDKIDLRCSQNHGWANGGSSRAETFVNDVFSRDTQGDMGQPYTRSRYYHLFINGQYWGLYQTEERVDANFGASYLGGDAEDFDTIRLAQPNYMLCAMDGTWNAYHDLWDLSVNRDLSVKENFMRLLGRNADGTRNAEYPVYLNPTNVMTYMMISHYTVDTDGPVTVDGFCEPNNINAVRNRLDDGKPKGFAFMRHDAEHSLGMRALDTNYTRGEASVDNDPTLWGTEANNGASRDEYRFTPAELHWRLLANAEYKMAFADQVYRHCLKKGGTLTAPVARARFESRMAEIDDAIQCEAARWATDGQTREDWLFACGKCTEFIDARLGYMIPQYRNHGVYPQVDAPSAKFNGEALGATADVPNGGSISLSGEGTIYYTTDGSDPRLEGGEPSASAYSAVGETDIAVSGDIKLRARVRTAEGEWSAMEFVDVNGYTANDEDVAAYLRISEVYGNTSDPTGDFGEYIVLTNLSDTVSLDLAGVRVVVLKAADPITSAKCDFKISGGVTLAPWASVKLSQDDYSSAGWTKITNNKISIYIFNKDGVTPVQTGYVEQKEFPSAYGLGASLIATSLEEEIGASDWRASDDAGEPESQLVWTTGTYQPNSWTPVQGNVMESAAVPRNWPTAYTEYNKDTLAKTPYVLTDGSVPPDGFSTFEGIMGNNGGEMVWEFDRTVASITQLRVFSRWCDGGRDGIYITGVSVRGTDGEWHVVAGEDNVCDYMRGANGNTDGTGALYAFLAKEDGTPFAKNVAALKITFGSEQDNSGTGYAEIEAIGTFAPVVPSAVNASGCITDFLHLGTNFATDDLSETGLENDLLAGHGGEANQRPYAGLSYDNLSVSSACTTGTTLTWTPVHRDDGFFEPGGRDFYTKYFHVYLQVPGTAPRKVHVYLKQDDDLRCWVNGRLAIDSIGWDNNGEKGPFAIYLRPGENSLTFRLREYNGGDYLRVRFADAEGRAITDITQSIMPTSAPVPRPAAAPRATALVAEDGKVRISLGNATKGVWYGYKFAERLEDLKNAEVIWLAEPATADGVLPLEHERTTSSGFYRIVVE